MLVIGLVGGVASGKSLVARHFAQLGASVIDADKIGHEVLRDPAVIRQVVERWGEEVLDSEGHIDRNRLAGVVFTGQPGGGPLAELESMTHPRIVDRIEQRLAELREAGTRVALLDAPVMLEAGWQRLCDRIVFVDAPSDERRRRALDRGWSEGAWRAREAAQWPVADKRSLATDVIDNAATPEQTRAQVERLWRQWAIADAHSNGPGDHPAGNLPR
jgi:dephospho-CoA kinase